MDDQSASNGTEADRPYDSSEMVGKFLAWLERGGTAAIPTWMIPPIDHSALISARIEAEQTARTSGRLDDFRQYRQAIIDWALGVFRRDGLNSVYFIGHSAPASVKVEAVEVLTDAMAGYLLTDILPEQVTATLFARLDVLLGGQIFPLEVEPQ